LEATVQLEELLETTMIKENFEKINQPMLILYYYKNEKEQDLVVSVEAIKNMFASVKTNTNNKKMIAVPNTGNHVIASPIQSKDIESVKKETALFLKNVFSM
jgi:hypothetical protein